MLNLNCTICSEKFTQSGEVVVTKCGHLFHDSCLNLWLQRSQTCPQCRNPCNNGNINRVYFNLDSGETPRSIDNGLLNELLDGANIQVIESERNLKKADEEIRLLTQTQHEYMETISDVNKKLEEKDAIITSLEDEVKRLVKEIEVLKNNFENALHEETKIRSELQQSEHNTTELTNTLKTVKEDLDKETQLRKNAELQLVQVEEMTSTTQQSENLLKAEIATLKSELEASLNTRTDISSTLETVQCYLQKEIEMKRLSEELLAQIRGSNLMNPAHINERHLMWLAKDKAKTAGWMFVWLKDGKILARKEKGTKVVHIATADDISKIE